METGHLNSIVNELHAIFSNARNRLRAVQVEAYMKNRFSYFGMPTEERRALQKPVLKAISGMNVRSERWQLIHLLWELPEREFQYVAIDWLNSWPKRWYDAADAEELYRLLGTKSWWDSVDAIASNYLGKWEQLFPKQARAAFEHWRYDKSFWLQRSCLIYQLKHKDKVDSAYLESLIAQLKTDKEFFIQKAIGWSLRQLSKHDPETVERIIAAQELKGLALREASKYL